MQNLSIPLHKARVFALLVISLIFVIVGILFNLSPTSFSKGHIYDVFIIRIIGFCAIIFFGWGGLSLTKMLSGNGEGIVFNEEGVLLHCCVYSLGLIRWNDILDVRIVKSFTKKVIVIDIKKPTLYIDRVHEGQRALLERNLRILGSPVAFSPRMLKMNAEEIQGLLVNYHQKYTSNEK